MLEQLVEESVAEWGPPKTEGTLNPVVTFRSSPKQRAWLDDQVRSGGSKLAKVVEWAVGLGKEYYEVLTPFHDRIDVLMKEEGITHAEAVEKVLKAGLTALEHGKKKR